MKVVHNKKGSKTETELKQKKLETDWKISDSVETPMMFPGLIQFGAIDCCIEFDFVNMFFYILYNLPLHCTISSDNETSKINAQVTRIQKQNYKNCVTYGS